MLLLCRHFCEATPERASRAESIFHLSPGYGSFNAISRSTNRPASASAIPCLKDSGIQESSFSTTNFATCARSLAGRALNCSITSVALMTIRILYQTIWRKIDVLLGCLQLDDVRLTLDVERWTLNVSPRGSGDLTQIITPS